MGKQNGHDPTTNGKQAILPRAIFKDAALAKQECFRLYEELSEISKDSLSRNEFYALSQEARKQVRMLETIAEHPDASVWSTMLSKVNVSLLERMSRVLTLTTRAPDYRSLSSAIKKAISLERELLILFEELRYHLRNDYADQIDMLINIGVQRLKYLTDLDLRMTK